MARERGPLVYADADAPNYRTQTKRREDDVRWLARLRKAVDSDSFDDITAMAFELDEMPRAPRWRTVAVVRAAYTITVRRWPALAAPHQGKEHG